MYRIEHKIAHLPVSDYIRNYRDVDRFMGYCKVCDKYNTCWACPPFDYDTDEYMPPYHEAYIIGTKIGFDPETIRDHRGTDVIVPLMDKVIEEVRRLLDPQLLRLEEKHPGGHAFYAGTCHICPMGKCARRDGKPCVAPERVRPALEALGFDIGKSTTDLLSIDLKWSHDGILPDYLTLVSGFFTPQPIPSFTLE